MVESEGFPYRVTIICNTSSINTCAYSSLGKPDWFVTVYQLKIFVIPRGHTLPIYNFLVISKGFTSSSQFMFFTNSLHYLVIPKGSYTNLQFWYYLKYYLLSDKDFCNTWRIPSFKCICVSSPFLSTVYAIEKTIIFLMPEFPRSLAHHLASILNSCECSSRRKAETQLLVTIWHHTLETGI